MPQALGQQIRALRKSRKLSTAALAAKINKSAGYVNNIERELSDVSVSALQTISTALGVQISWFFQGQGHGIPEEAGIIVRRGQGRQISLSGGGIQEQLLSPGNNQQCQIIQTTHAPGSSSGEAPIQQDAQRSGFILAGKLQLRIDETSYELHSGDSFVIHAGQSHFSDNPFAQTCVSIWVITPAIY